MEVPARGLHFLPVTAWGRWAGGFGIALIAVIVVFALLIPFGPGNAVISKVAVPAVGILAATCATAAVFSGLISIVFRHERSVAAFVATGIGLLGLVPVVGELTVPH